jgi:predicted DNA-binding transcriptional regulator AlpA
VSTRAKKAHAKKPARPWKGKPQHAWLRRPREIPAPTPEVSSEHDTQSVRLMSKEEVCATVGVTYPTLWSMMIDGKFPRSRSVGGKSMWRSDEVQSWMKRLPLVRLKNDPEAAS